MEEVIFNGRVELALRLAFIIKNTKREIDLQRLLYYNYLIVHSSDINGGPKSLHPELPNRSCEILVLREVIKDSLKILIAKELIDVKYKKQGIFYSKNKSINLFISYFDSEYSKAIDSVSTWVCERFDKQKDKEISMFINKNLSKWGEEFSQIN